MKKLVGRVGVDSGQIIITDPCYLKDFKSDDYDQELIEAFQEDEKFPYSYNGVCAKTMMDEPVGEVGNRAQGVASNSGFGDGTYPVFAHIEGGRVQKLEIVFFEEGEGV